MGNQVKAAKTQARRLQVAPARHQALLPAPRALVQAAGPEESRRRCGRFGQCGDARGEQVPHLILFAGIQIGQHVLLDAANRGSPGEHSHQSAHVHMQSILGGYTLRM